MIFTNSIEMNISITYKIYNLNIICLQVEHLNYDKWTGLNRDPPKDDENRYNDQENTKVRESAMCLVS